MQNSFKPGQQWFDTDGQLIQAHGGSVLYHNGTFFWYGENKEKTNGVNGIWHNGVKCYSSSDLYNWKNEGIILEPDYDNLNNPLHPTRIMDRPHILYHSDRRQFVMWVKFAGTTQHPDDWRVQYMGVAVSASITEPFHLIHTLKPLGMNSGDFDLYKNPVDGKAYIIFGRVHTEVIIADLSEDYTSLNGYYSAHFPRSGPPFAREAPAMFRRNHRFYLLTSGTTGFQPNPTEAASAQLIHGPWIELGEVCREDKQKDSFNCQFSSVFQHPHKQDLYIALGDRWMDGAVILPGQPIRWNTSISGYAWLPIRFDGDRPVIEWRDEWSLDEFEERTEPLPWWETPAT